MNFKKFINSDYLKENPLCGIGTYKDELNLATGNCTKKIKKLVLTGEENITKVGGNAPFRISTPGLFYPGVNNIVWLCNQYQSVTNSASWIQYDYLISWSTGDIESRALRIRDINYINGTVDDFKSYLRQQYVAGTPVTIWYVLAEPTTETITVPSGLSGTEEGYLIQDGTPTPTNPIYPTANTVEKWFDINCYIHKTDIDTTTTLPAIIYPTVTTATVRLKGDTFRQSGTPTPDNPITPVGTGDLEAIGAKAGQYKIPILSANTTTPVYLGEVQTTRKIKKLVLTGEEIYIKDSGGEYFYYIYNLIHMYQTYCFCSHLVHTKNYPRYEVGCFTYGNSSVIYLNFGGDVMDEQPSGNTVAGIKEYIAAQYAAGTPVTIWYVLAEPETGIVNEPLMKIGDYADEVSDITIPTIVGKNTFDVETTLKPSEASINYTGWHDTEVKEYISDTSIADWEKMSIAQMENHTIQELQGGNWV